MARIDPVAEFAFLFGHELDVTRLALQMRKPDAAARIERLRQLAESRRHIEGHIVADKRILQVNGLIEVWGDPRTLTRLPTDLVAVDTTMVKGRQVQVVLARNTDLGPTPEAAAKPSRVSPVMTLYRGKHIDEDGVRVAKEIAWVVEEVSRSGRARAQMLQAAGGTSPFWRQYMSDNVAAVWSGRYAPWARRQRAMAEFNRSRNLDACLAAIVFGESLASMEARMRHDRRKVTEFIAAGIADYVEICRKEAAESHRPAGQIDG